MYFYVLHATSRSAILTMLKIIVGGILLFVLLAKELIDLAATVDFIEQKFPWLIRWAERNAWQRVLPLVVTLMYAAILYEFLTEPEPPSFVFAYPTAADAENRQMRDRIRELEKERLSYRSKSNRSENAIETEVRTLTDTEQQLVIQTLRSAAGSPVSIVEVGNIPEPHIVAQQLADTFSAAGWNVRRSAMGSSTRFVVGVGGTSTVTAMSPRGLCAEAMDVGDEPVRAVKEALENIHRTVPILRSKCPDACACPGPSQTLREHELHLVVGPR
jgi:hypothetical protein